MSVFGYTEAQLISYLQSGAERHEHLVLVAGEEEVTGCTRHPLPVIYFTMYMDAPYIYRGVQVHTHATPSR
jgi:hypothetical protein